MEGPEGRSKNPYIALAICLPKTSSLKQAGFFKKLFKKIKRFFQKVFQAVVKVLIKIRNALQKFLQTGFGKVVGFIFGGPLILAALNFAINSFSYLAQGDIKGLFKYWGQNAIQIALMAASFALMFIPGLGQALAAGLQFLMKGLFAAVQFALGAALQFVGSLVSGLGSVLGSFAQGLGGFVRGIGGFISNAGRSLVQGAKSLFQSSVKELFQSFKDLNFSKIIQNFKDRLLDQINPLRNLKIGIGDGRIDGIRIPGIGCQGLSFVSCGGEGGSLLSQIIDPLKQKLGERLAKSGIMDSSFMKTLVKIGNAISLQFLKDKIDKKLEKSKMNEFVKGLIRTVSHAGIDALSNGMMALATVATGGAAGPLAALGKVGAVLGKVGTVLGRVGQAVKAVAGTVFNAVKATGSFLWNATKTIGSAIGRGLQFVGSKIIDGFQAIGRGIGKVWEGTKSFFSNLGQKIFGTRQPPVNAQQLTRYGSSGGFALGDDFAGKITFGPDAFKFEKIPTALAQGANGVPTELLQGNSRFILNPVSENLLRADLDAGDLAFVKPDSRFDVLTRIERIGNLKDTLVDLATQGPVGIGERIGRRVSEVIPVYEHFKSSTPDGYLNFQLLGVDNSLSYDVFHYNTEARIDPLVGLLRGRGEASVFNALYRPSFRGTELPTVSIDFQKVKLEGGIDNFRSIGGSFFVGFLDFRTELPVIQIGDLQIRGKGSVSLISYARDFRVGVDKLRFEFANGLGGLGLDLEIQRRKKIYGLN